MYGLDNDEYKIGNLKKISELLNIVLTKKNKKNTETTKKNPLLMGIPVFTVDKYVRILI